MPTITSKKMYDHVDGDNPNISFKESVYYQEKRHLGGMMSQKSLSQLKNRIRVEMGEHRRDVYDLSPDPAKRSDQVRQMVARMDDSVQASRLENLLLSGDATSG